MNIFFTFDYELFFGSNTGTIDNCIINPTNELIKIGDRYHAKFVFFVDSGYIIKLDEYRKKFPRLNEDYYKIVNQIKELHSKGHDIQLHIHPHWEDCYFNGQKWEMDTSRFRLHLFSNDQINDIVYRYKKVLTDIVGESVFAFRAGGWCLQPFDNIQQALKSNNIWLDCTVFKGGLNESKTHYYDFRNAPEMETWRFENDPLVVVNNGFFQEVAFSTYRVSPFFFWKHLFTRLLPNKKLKFFGDGQGASFSKKYVIRLLTSFSNTIVSLDGFKSSFLEKSYRKHIKEKKNNFVVIGHPKGLNPYAISKLDSFLNKNSIDNTIITFKDYNNIEK
jgi:hypothetical protein